MEEKKQVTDLQAHSATLVKQVSVGVAALEEAVRTNREEALAAADLALDLKRVEKEFDVRLTAAIAETSAQLTEKMQQQQAFLQPLVYASFGEYFCLLP